MSRIPVTLWRRDPHKITVAQLARRTWHEMQQGQSGNRAAELAFFFTLAFFPLLIFLITLLGFVPGAEELILGYLDKVLPAEGADIIHRWIAVVFHDRNEGLLSISLLLTLWSASSGVAALIDVLNVAYDVRERRPWWKYRLTALLLTAGLSVLVLGGALLFTFGSDALDWLASLLHIDQTVQALTKAANYLVGLIMLFSGIMALHYYGPDTTQRWHLLIPGAVMTVVGILAVSRLFTLYLQFAPSYNAVYGSLGAIVIFIFWLYLVSLMVIIGGEMNSEIKKAA